MKDTEYIIGVYNFINASFEVHSDSAFYFLYLLDEKGLLDKSVALKLYNERFKSDLSSADIHQNMIGLFEDALYIF